MRVAFVVHQFPTLSETFVLDQITGLLKRGHDVDIYASTRGYDGPFHPDVEEYDLYRRIHSLPPIQTTRLGRFFQVLHHVGWSVCQAPGIAPAFAKAFWQYRRDQPFVRMLQANLLMKIGPVDVVQAHFGDCGEIAAFCKEHGILKAPVVTMFHGVDIRQGIKRGPSIYTSLRRSGDLVLSISKYNREHLESMGFAEERVIDHPVGTRIPCSLLKNPVGDRVRILSVARLVPEKGLADGLNAIAILKRLLRGRPFEYRIIGGGPLEADLKAVRDQLGLAEEVEFLGAQPREVVQAELQQADVCFMPSRAEALPVALMEAGAAGLPAVATDVGSVKELVLEGETGFVVPSGEAHAMAEALHRLSTDLEKRQVFGYAARQHIASRYNIETLNDRLVEIYRSLKEAGERGQV